VLGRPMDRKSECRGAQGSAGATDGQEVRVPRSTGKCWSDRWTGSPSVAEHREVLERPMDRKSECRGAQDVRERLYVHPFRASLPAWPRPASRPLRGLTFSMPPAMMDRMSGAATPSSASLSRIPALRDDGQDVRSGHPFQRIALAHPCAPRCTYVPVGKKKGAVMAPKGMETVITVINARIPPCSRFRQPALCPRTPPGHRHGPGRKTPAH